MTKKIQTPDPTSRLADRYGIVGGLALDLLEDVSPVVVIDNLVPAGEATGRWAGGTGVTDVIGVGESGFVTLETTSPNVDLLVDEVMVSKEGAAIFWTGIVKGGASGLSPGPTDNRDWLDRRNTRTAVTSEPAGQIVHGSSLVSPGAPVWIRSAGTAIWEVDGTIRLTNNGSPLGALVSNHLTIMAGSPEVPIFVTFRWREVPFRQPTSG